MARLRRAAQVVRAHGRWLPEPLLTTPDVADDVELAESVSMAMLDVLAPDVVLVADGGGVVQAVVRPVLGAKKVANLLRPFTRVAPGAKIVPVLLNGAVGALIVGTEDGYDTAVSLVVEGRRISRISAVRNPAKLGRIDVEATISR